MGVRDVKIHWPQIPNLSKTELRILKKINYWRTVWNISASISQLRIAKRLEECGYIEPFDPTYRRCGWHLTQVGIDILRTLAVRE